MLQDLKTPRTDPLSLPPIVDADPVAVARALLSYRVELTNVETGPVAVTLRAGLDKARL